jgi:PAS domain S-box-containing protein
MNQQKFNLTDECFRIIVQNAMEIFFVTDMDSNILEVNEETCRQSGYSRKELLSMNALTLRVEKPEDITQIPAKLKELGSLTEEINVKSKDGSIRYYVINVKYLDINSGILFHFARDVTEQKRMENELEQYRLHLEELVRKRTNELEEEILQHTETEKKLKNQMEQRADFMRILVHELKTPLTPLLSISDLLLSQYNYDISLIKQLDKINKGIIRLSKRIDEIMDLSKGEIGLLSIEIKGVDMVSLLNDAASYIEPQLLRKAQNIFKDIPESLPLVWGDEERLYQVIINLLDNASKFTIRKGQIELSAKVTSSNLIVKVKNSGVCLTEEQQKIIFNPYQRLPVNQSSSSGLGLGLALSRKLIELHGGKIWVESNVNEGNIFGFSLPISSRYCTLKGTA